MIDEEMVKTKEVYVGMVNVRIPYGMRPTYEKFMGLVMPKITQAVSDTLSSLLCSWADVCEEAKKGGAK